MGLLEILQGGIATANKVLDPLQSTVTFYRCTSVDARGKPVFASPVSLKAVVDAAKKNFQTAGGEVFPRTAEIIFLDVPALATATLGLGVKDLDMIVLPDGSTGPILKVGGYVDPGTGQPVATEVTLG